MAALGSAAVAMLVNQAIAQAWQRPRPFTVHPGGTHLLTPPSPDPSFPSDHAAAAFAIAFAILVFSRRGGAGFLAAATLLALSRSNPRGPLPERTSSQERSSASRPRCSSPAQGVPS